MALYCRRLRLPQPQSGQRDVQVLRLQVKRLTVNGWPLSAGIDAPPAALSVICLAGDGRCHLPQRGRQDMAPSEREPRIKSVHSHNLSL